MPFYGNIPTIGQVEGTTFVDDPIVANSNRNAAHNLGQVPNMLVVQLVCKTAQANYSPGDVIHMANMVINGGGMGGTDYGFTPWADATNVGYWCHTNRFQILNKTTGALTTITAANWIVHIHSYL